MQLLVKVTNLQFISIAELSADLRLNTGHTRMHACTGLQDYTHTYIHFTYEHRHTAEQIVNS